MKHTRLAWTLAALSLVTALQAQMVELSPEEYGERKANGTLPPQFHVAYSTLPVAGVQASTTQGHAKGSGTGQGCNCWIEPDNTYSLAMAPNDDGFSDTILLPFQFDLYGDRYDHCWINNNGNISFVGPVTNYVNAPNGAFPAHYDTVMVAPFWADVDTHWGPDYQLGSYVSGGSVVYKLTPTALYVNWVSVGYFHEHVDKRNTFQLIITDGTDPVIGVGNNVSFCYKEMNWTTGDASSGQNGFGGYPAIVGANRGNNVDYIQFGLFDHPGSDYDGPFGHTDGVSWLNNQNFVFTTAVSTQNIPPIVSSSFLCDTVRVCNGELVDFDVTFLTPEADQVITNATASAPTLPSFRMTALNNGVQYTLHPSFRPNPGDAGFHTITFSATDNGTPPLTTTVDLVLEVIYTSDTPPVISGDSTSCNGQTVVLTAQPGFSSYQWSNTSTDTAITVGPGTYRVFTTAGICRLASNAITVVDVTPHPVIQGDLLNCTGAPILLGTTQPYAAYDWSEGSHTPTISVGTGTYSVSVTNSAGCTGTSPSVHAVSTHSPTASFNAIPGGAVFPNTTVAYTNTSASNGTTITNMVWTIGTLGISASGETLSQTFTTAGVYPVTLMVTTSDGCTSTHTYDQVVIPEEIITPNVFSPNNDGENDRLVFSGAEYYDNDLQIFNRWGQVVFASTNYRNTWIGQDLPEGTYFYVLKLINTGKVYTGHVTLLR
ncbi:MAG: gliding motility-associated C-terminal domain-containing protein [Flavobacteriales bacterium]